MIQPTLHFVNCPDATGSHRMAYWQWGDPASAHVVLCVHGLTRQGRDFDVLARALCERASVAGSSLRVICPDVVGRGQSDWLKDPAGYQIPAYAADMLALFAKLQAEAPIGVLDWVGTSMGGLIGLLMCGQPDLPLPQRVRKLVLNDVGPTVEWSALQRIGTYLGKSGEFESVQQAADAMWATSSSFGPHTPAQWLALSTPMLRLVDNPDTTAPKRWKLHYDPAIAEPFCAATETATEKGQALLWRLYDQISANTLLLRGVESDLLSVDTAKAMTESGPRARLVEFKGVGHAPTMTSADQVAVVADFLMAADEK
ncbi:MAG: alpha/beta hydrolase [Polaromonas sp.]|nr:alpha/beta hydrolase [Polaromonas sp.]